MAVMEILKSRKVDLQRQVDALDREIKDVDVAIAAILKANDGREQAASSPQAKHSMPVDDAIIRAVGAGMKTPTDILSYLERELGINTTINSIRTRVSRLKKNKKIGHDATGWLPLK
jgi:hypothetical protein